MNTKEILEKNKTKNSNPLYRKEALEEIQKDLFGWINALPSEVAFPEASKSQLGTDAILRHAIYSPMSTPDFDYQESLGFSGQAPFTRGVYPSMYKGKEFTMRQLTGLGLPEDTNKRMKFMIENGATGINVLFDIPTIQMYDSDDPASESQVGRSGVCIDSIDDMHALFQGINLEQTTISLVTHYPTNTAILFGMFLAMAEERGASWHQLRGSVQNDTTMEEVVRSGLEFITPADCFRIQCDNIEFMRKCVPNWNVITLNGYNLREAGTDGVTEIAVAMSNGIATFDEMIKRGYTVDQIAERVTFFFSIASDFFEEVSRLRAARRLWGKIMKYRFNAQDLKSMRMRCHVQTSGISLTKEEPLNNIVRASYHALSAIFGGVQSLHVDSYDEAYSIPTEQSALVSLRTQQIIQEETGVIDVVDPLGGSYYIESLTNTFEKRIIDEIDRIEILGGYVSMVSSGCLNNEVADYAYRQNQAIESQKIRIVGNNVYEASSNDNVGTLEPDATMERKQQVRLSKLRFDRDEIKVMQTTSNLCNACHKKKNLMPFIIECAKARCTEGEIANIIRGVLPPWERPAYRGIV